jgi:general stress protein 26
MRASRTTVEMRTPEEHRERLHGMVKAPCAVMVMLCTTCGAGVLDCRLMALVRTSDDTTMYVATSLDHTQLDKLRRGLRVTVVVPGPDLALFAAEARISHERRLLDELWSDSWNQWFRGKSDPTLAILILSPIEGAYWDAMDQHSYVYRRMQPAPAPRPAPPPTRDYESDGIPIEM